MVENESQHNFRTWKGREQNVMFFTILSREPAPFRHWRKYLHTTPQPNIAGDWREIAVCELQYADLRFQLQEIK